MRISAVTHWLGALGMCALTACSDSDDKGSSPTPNGRGTGPGDWTAGDYPPDLRGQSYLTIRGVSGQNGAVRGYKVHVPASYDEEDPTPVVFAIHGLSQNAVMFGVDGAEWVKKSDQEGFILVLPTGVAQASDGSWPTSGSWNAGECCGAAAQSGVDDVALIRAIAEEVGTHLNVDKGRMYATGFSNGGFLSFRLACEAADLFAAIAPASGAIGMSSIAPIGIGNQNLTTCNPSHPVPVLAMHGTADILVPHRYMQPSLDLMAKANGCSTSTSEAASPVSGGDTSCVSYTGCPDGVEVTGCTVQNGGHCWFGSPNCGTGDTSGIAAGIVGANSNTLVNTQVAWDFLKRFSRD